MSNAYGALEILSGLAVCVAVPTYVLWFFAKRVPSRYQCPGYRSGFGGWLVVFLAGQVAVMERLLLQAYSMGMGLSAMHIASAEQKMSVFVALAPLIGQLVMGVLLLYFLCARREAAAIAFVIILLWLMGPVTVLVSLWFFSLQMSSLGLLQIFGWAICWSVYLVISPRVALTYGTKRGSRLAA